MAELTPKQRAFVAEYLIDLNASAAARRAGYSTHRADAIGHEVLRKPEIVAAIAAAQLERSQRTQIDADWILKRLADMAEADAADLYNRDGGIKPIHDWPMVWRRGLVAGFDTSEERGADGDTPAVVRKVKLADRLKTLELIGRHVAIGAWRDKVEHMGPGGGPIQVASVSLVPMKAADESGD